METLLKRKRVVNYLDSMGCLSLYNAIIGEVLYLALKDDVTELVFSKEEFEIMNRFMIQNGQWNWDKKTFMGIKLEVV